MTTNRTEVVPADWTVPKRGATVTVVPKVLVITNRIRITLLISGDAVISFIPFGGGSPDITRTSGPTAALHKMEQRAKTAEEAGQAATADAYDAAALLLAQIIELEAPREVKDGV